MSANEEMIDVLAGKMLAYVRDRARIEGVEFGLTLGFFAQAIRMGINPIFGVRHDGARMTGDDQEPHHGYFEQQQQQQGEGA